MKQHLFVLLLLMSACWSDETIVNLSKHKSYEVMGGQSLQEELFCLNIGGDQIDELNRLNPKLFPQAKLTEKKDDDVLIKSVKTSKTYKANLKKGDRIYLPRFASSIVVTPNY
jgi:hypothetical protein